MAKHTHHSGFITHSITRREADALWSDDYRSDFEPNAKNLFMVHKVPKFKKRHQCS